MKKVYGVIVLLMLSISTIGCSSQSGDPLDILMDSVENDSAYENLSSADKAKLLVTGYKQFFTLTAGVVSTNSCNEEKVMESIENSYGDDTSESGQLGYNVLSNMAPIAMDKFCVDGKFKDSLKIHMDHMKVIIDRVYAKYESK